MQHMKHFLYAISLLTYPKIKNIKLNHPSTEISLTVEKKLKDKNTKKSKTIFLEIIHSSI